MPHVTLQVSPSHGPVIDVLVGVSGPREQALRRSGQPIPLPVQIRALIDTGASGTCIDPDSISQLGIPPRGHILIHTPSTGGQPHQCKQYDVSLTLTHPGMHMTLMALPVTESQLAVQGIQALIGRDVLASCLFVYDGADGRYSLAF